MGRKNPLIGNKLKMVYLTVLFWAPYFFLIYINDLPKILDGNSHTVLYADDTSILIIGSNKRDLEENTNLTFQKIIKWFNSNRLTLNLNKTQFLEVNLKHSPNDGIKLKYEQMHMNAT